jgi:hypothetical protein
VAGESLTQLDWTAIATFVGVGVGTAIAVVLNYKKTKSEPAPTVSSSVVLPSATIADMKPVTEAATSLREIALCLGSIHISLIKWREADEERLEKQQIEEEAFRRGAKWRESLEQRGPPLRPGPKRRPDAD